MLNNIHIANVASFGTENQQFRDLNVVNFIFGENGSGKSTIARLIEDDKLPEFTHSKLDWDAYGPVTRLVYCRKFIDETLREKVKGVFTLGDKAGTKQDILDNKVIERKKFENKIGKLNEAREKKHGEIEKENNRFKEKCWSLKLKYESVFGEAFKGVKANKNLFKEKCLNNQQGTPKETFDELVDQTKTFFHEQPDPIPPLAAPTSKSLALAECAEIFKEKILGKKDVPIADMIQKLGNSDWVRQGINYLRDDICPFCQQRVSDNLQQDLERYFDESFTQKMTALADAISQYNREVNSLIEHYESLYQEKSKFFSPADIREKVESIKIIYEKNNELLRKKIREPSTTITISTLSERFAELNRIIIEKNTDIIKYNKKIKNFKEEKNELIDKVWGYLGGIASEFYDDHIKIATPIQAAFDGIKANISKATHELSQLNIDIAEIEKDLTSTAPSKDGINAILQSFGFDNFKLEDAEDEGYYRIVRSDGTFAQETLSEGERTFITFLYFYQLIQGSTSRSGITSPRIIVFDDPVSSLDSKILFVVSTLIRGLFCSDNMGKLNIIQIVILTHNVYFHKEVSFTEGLRHIGTSPLTERNFSYWIVRKQNGKSSVVDFDENPIKTNYQLLWQEVKRCMGHPEYSINICNTLRRILENYFKILGGIDLTELASDFEGEEKLVFRSLTSWIHDGSHCMYDGIDIGFGQDLVDHYLPVFKKIFEKTKHEKHYEMMINACN